MKVRKKQLTRQQRLALLPVISLIGIALIALGIVQNRRMNESMPVEAEITGYREVSSENIMGENGKTTAYYAEYRYIVDGEEYTAVSDRASATAPVIGRAGDDLCFVAGRRLRCAVRQHLRHCRWRIYRFRTGFFHDRTVRTKNDTEDSTAVEKSEMTGAKSIKCWFGMDWSAKAGGLGVTKDVPRFPKGKRGTSLLSHIIAAF